MYNYGKKSLLDAINNNLKIIEIYTIKKNHEFIKSLNLLNIKINWVDESWFNKNNDVKHQFIAYTVDKKNISLKEMYNLLETKSQSIVLIIDEIEDTRNFGSILRTCDAFNIDAIFYKKNNQAQINDIVNTISVGATNYLNLYNSDNLNNVINNLKKFGFWVYATTLSNNSVAYNIEQYPNKVAIIVGNENKGISPLIIKNSDMQIHIPMFGHVQSLNVSVATGIILNHLINICNKNIKK